VTDPHNRRSHPARNVDMLATALSHVGAARSIVIDESNEVLAGNGVLAAAAQVGITKLHVVETDGNTLVAVRRTGLTPDQKRQLAMYDNRTAELAEWNLTQLQADLAAGADLTPFFFDQELEALLAPPGTRPVGVTGGSSQWVIIITCDDEDAQAKLLTRLMGEGLVCRAVVS
jgi:hypothetical protein